MMKISIKCTRFKTNYSNFTSKSSENICNNNRGAKEKGRTGFVTKTQVPTPLNANGYCFWESHAIYDQTEGFSVVFLIL